MTLLQETDSLKKTPLYDRHIALGAKIVDFSGWALPVYYESILAEHLYVRRACGFFDVSHLGEIRVKGAGAFGFLQGRLTNDMNKLRDRRMLYSILCDEKGLTLDDILVYREGPDDYSLIVNAANIEVDMDALLRYAPDTLIVRNDSDKIACVAVQGPASEAIMESVFSFTVRDLDYYAFKELRFQDEPVWVSRSGYTGEDGFEIFSANALAPSIWDSLVERGVPEGAKPAGLGARNTLRLEAGNALYGHEMDRSTTPIEAGLQWAVSFTKGAFVGRDALMKQKETGVDRRLIGFRMLDKPVPRDGYALLKEGRKIGRVTSGSFGPSVDAGIGLGFVTRGVDTTPSTRIEVEIHGQPVPAEIVKLPFIPTQHKRTNK